MSNALLEAMATGKPIVACAIEGVHEVLQGGPGCQLSDPERPDQMIERLTQILRQKQLASQAGVFNRRRIEERFTLQRMISQFHGLIESTL